MKANVFILIAFLSFHGFEATPLFYAQFGNPKTCCGRSVCLCTHSKGAPCPFKHKVFGTYSGAHESIQESQGDPLSFKKAPCHSEQAKTTAPSYSKDFCLFPTGLIFGFKPQERFFHSKNLILHILFDHSLDKPPNIYLSF